MTRDVILEDPIQRVVPRGTSRHGLVIGIGQYADARLNLRYAVADARLVRDLMVDATCGCFPLAHVQCLLDQEATKAKVDEALARLSARASENDDVWIYYAGHGAVQGSDAYWVTHDADVDHLYATALHSGRISETLSRFRASRLFVILDCCHAAATAYMKNPTRQVVTAADLFGRFKGQGRVVLAASDGKQRSVELAEHGHGAFTYYLEQGLRGAADADGAGVVTIDKLWSYLGGKVRDASGRVGNPQTPTISGVMTHGVPLTVNAALMASRQRLRQAIESLVRLREPRLTTNEGQLCLDILHRGPHTAAERELLEGIQELEAGRLIAKLFCSLVRLHVKHAAVAPPPPVPPTPSPGAPSPAGGNRIERLPSEQREQDTDPGSAVTPEASELTPWAVASGRDPYGPWAAFAVKGVQQRMRWIPPGRFLMGSPATESGRYVDEGPQHEVTLTHGYWLGETAVTQALWVAVMGKNPSRFQSYDRPVEQVSWDDCQGFLRELNARVARLAARLPTEAEWEWACRGGTTTATWVGDLTLCGLSSAPELDAIAWYRGNSGVGFELNNGEDSSDWPEKQHPHTKAGTHPVGRLQPNPYGLYDMLGNVLQWCADAGLRGYTTSAVTNPMTIGRGSPRVDRGGSWYGLARHMRAASRDANPRGSRFVNLGLRLAGGQAALR